MNPFASSCPPLSPGSHRSESTWGLAARSPTHFQARSIERFVCLLVARCRRLGGGAARQPERALVLAGCRVCWRRGLGACRRRIRAAAGRGGVAAAVQHQQRGGDREHAVAECFHPRRAERAATTRHVFAGGHPSIFPGPPIDHPKVAGYTRARHRTPPVVIADTRHPARPGRSVSRQRTLQLHDRQPDRRRQRTATGLRVKTASVA